MYQKKIEAIYSEDSSCGNSFRVTYLEGIKKLINDRKKQALMERINFGKQISNDRESYRKQYLDMLGWPLNDQRQPILNVSENLLFENNRYIISRLQFELFEGFWFYGILFRHQTKKALPLVVVQHGAGGTPELCSSFFDSENYNDMTLRILGKGMNVFAPQMDLWASSQRFGPADCRGELDKCLKQLGGSITALEIYSVQRCLDYFEQQIYHNGEFGMAGLSYGGFYTLYTAAADKRIKAALACCHFNDRTRYNMVDKVWFNAANTFLDAQVAALVCPRSLRIEVGDNDEVFAVDSAIKEYEILKDYFLESPDNLQFHVFSGVHEFCPDDEGVDWLSARLLE